MIIQVIVPGMACTTCANNIINAIKSVDHEALVTADPETKLVRVETQATERVIMEALIAAGYPPA
jgi:copper chaperone